jgi:hypothetical protein
VHLSVSLVNWSLVAYFNFIPKGEIKIAATPAPVLPHAPSQYTSNGDSWTASSTEELGSVHSATKSARIYDFITLCFSKSTKYFESSIAHLLILPELSLLPKMSFNG